MSKPEKNSNLSPSLSESPGAVPHSDTVNRLRVGSFYMDGWIKLHRKIRDNWIWGDPVKFQWWIDILLEVNHTGKKVPLGFEIIECKRGESIRSLHGWASRWGVSKDTARNFIRMLEKDNMIECVSLQKTTRITVCNYDNYQADLHVKKPKSKRQANDNRPQTDPNKNDKNEKNDKEIIYPFDSENFKNVWNIWKEYKKKEHKFRYASDITEQAALKNLGELSNQYEQTAIDIIFQSIQNGWKGLFKLKQDGKDRTNNKGTTREQLARAFAKVYASDYPG